MVDDEPSIADTLAAILRSAAYEVTVAYNAASALQHCNGNPPDFVISDVVMPGMNGVELAIHMRQQYPGLKIVLFSGMANATDLLEKAREQGYEFTLLAKPIPPADLLANLHE